MFALVAIPQLVIDSVQLKVVIPWGGRDIKMYGAVAMIPYYLGFALFVLLAARTRYKAPLYLYMAAILCGLSVLAKGLAGLGLPVIVFVAYLAFTWNWRRLKRAQLRYGIIVVAGRVCASWRCPWHHAMLIRHGGAFWNELFGDNHWRRMVIGRHGDRGTFEYFVRELGYGVLPWIALVPAALGWAVHAARGARRARAPTTAETRKQGIIWLGAIWFVGGVRRGLAVDDQVPSLRVARDSGPGDRRRLLHRRSGGPPRLADRGGGGAGRHPAAGAGVGGPGRREERGAASSCGCSRTTTSTATRPPLARPARLFGGADRSSR